jgi:short-subunit dehydrogenase
MTSNILIVGATRGLGAALAALYSKNPSIHVFGTSRSSTPPSEPKITWLAGIDVSESDVGEKLVSQVPPSIKFSTVIITAGYFGLETFDTPDWEKQTKMYTVSAISPVFIVHHLVKAGLLENGSKVIIVSSESGSITLRHEKEGGGNYGHHASKAASNMVGKLLSLDLKPHGIAVGLVHPGFMRTEMTKGVGFDKYWDDGGGQYTPNIGSSLSGLKGFILMNLGQP